MNRNRQRYVILDKWFYCPVYEQFFPVWNQVRRPYIVPLSRFDHFFTLEQSVGNCSRTCAAKRNHFFDSPTNSPTKLLSHRGKKVQIARHEAIEDNFLVIPGRNWSRVKSLFVSGGLCAGAESFIREIKLTNRWCVILRIGYKSNGKRTWISLY